MTEPKTGLYRGMWPTCGCGGEIIRDDSGVWTCNICDVVHPIPDDLYDEVPDQIRCP